MCLGVKGREQSRGPRRKTEMALLFMRQVTPEEGGEGGDGWWVPFGTC